MELSFVVLGVIAIVALAVYFRPKAPVKTVLENMLAQEQDQQDDPLVSLNYDQFVGEKPDGITEDGWLRFYTVTSGEWFGHELFQTLTSLGCTLDSQQCLVYKKNGRALFKIIKTSEPVTFDLDDLGKERLDGLAWFFDTEQESSAQMFAVMREVCSAFTQEMGGALVNQQKDLLSDQWFDSVCTYLAEKEVSVA